MKENNIKADDVYRITGFSDLVSSPVFYSVLVLTIILGLSSIFGFLQNPHKLKAVVDVMSQKVSISQHDNIRVVNRNEYSMSHSLAAEVIDGLTASYPDVNRYSIFAYNFYNSGFGENQTAGFKPVSFEYDITSRQFWGDLDISRIESALEESQRLSNDAFMIGAPLEPNYSLGKGDSKYYIKAVSIISL